MIGQGCLYHRDDDPDGDLSLRQFETDSLALMGSDFHS